MLPRQDESPAFTTLCLVGLLVRFVFIGYGVWHDTHHMLKYTDVDYFVFSDATHFLLHPSPDNHAAGPLGKLLPLGNPFSRATYRYTPLLSLLLAPNALHPLWGKLLFSIADVGICILLNRMLLLQRQQHNAKLVVSIAWLFNPMPINIATRGSSEALLGLLVLACLYAALKQKWSTCAALLGAATHFKIYPVIYAVSLIVHLAHGDLRQIVSKRTVRFGCEAFSIFMALNLAMYLLWGQPFLDEAFLYHLRRLDHRHNFSSAFYPIALSGSSNPLSSFAPQMMAVLMLGTAFARDLPIAWFLQTVAFVTFNKVCTSQYFLWYLWLLPLVLGKLHLSKRNGALMLVWWVGGQAGWLMIAYHLEMAGSPVHFLLWSAGLTFQIIHALILTSVVRAYTNHKQDIQVAKSM